MEFMPQGRPYKLKNLPDTNYDEPSPSGPQVITMKIMSQGTRQKDAVSHLLTNVDPS
jgi:hypothetical protein